MMKKIITLIVPLLVFAGCSKDGNEIESYARFTQTEVRVSATAEGVSLALEWSRTTWELSTAGNGFITRFAPESGGDESQTNKNSSVWASLTANGTTAERRQEVVVTNRKSGETSRLTIIQAAGSVLPPEPDPDPTNRTSVSLDPATSYQHVVGFGGMYNPVIWLGGDNLITNDDITRMYSPDGLGYNILRLMIYPNERDWAADVAGARLAQQHGAIVFACPWDCTDALADRVTVNGKEMKHLKPENYRAYADHLIRYINYMKGQGVNIYAVSVQNEPDMEFTYWRPAEVATFVKSYGDLIRATGVKLMSPEACGMSYEYTNPILSDAAAFANTDIVAGHLYQGFTDHSSSYVKNRHDYIVGLYDSHLKPAGKTWWMTEHLFNDGERETDPSKWQFRQWRYELEHLGKEIHMSMEGYCSAYVYWYLKRFYGMIADSDQRSQTALGAVLGNGYILSHYAKYASGRTRIAARVASGSPVSVTAYRGEGELTLVLINFENTATRLTIASPDAVAGATAAESSANKKMAAVTTTLGEDGRSVSLNVSAQSIVSVKLQLQE